MIEKELAGRRAWEKGTKRLHQCRGKYTKFENQKILLVGTSKDVASLGWDPQKCIPIVFLKNLSNIVEKISTISKTLSHADLAANKTLILIAKSFKQAQ